MKKIFKRLFLLAAASISAVAFSVTKPFIVVNAVAPAAYYSTADSSTGQNLASSLHTIISDHKDVGYSGLWNAYKTTDVMPGTNYVWDMYSSYRGSDGTIKANYYFEVGGKKQGASYSKESDGYNREHSIPQSWFKEASPMKADLFHVYPTDGYVNNRRSNYPYGEVGNATYTSQNGSKLGSSKLSGISGTVFEPIDEYKGDFARSYFYMAVCYSNKSLTSGEGSKVFKSTYPYLTDYAIELFTKWDAQDPVSEKEIARNDNVYSIQKNRNPFIDHPEYTSIIWPSKYNQNVEVDENKVNNVIGLINNLPSNITLDDKEEVNKVNTAYEALNYKEKALVTNYSKLQNALAKIKELEPTPTTEVISVSQALNIIKGLDNGATTKTKYIVSGVISGNIEAYNSQYNNATFDMNDGQGDSITAFRLKDGSDSTYFTANSFAEKIAVGKNISVEGYLQKYVDKSNNVKFEIVNGFVTDYKPVNVDPVDPTPVDPTPVDPVDPTPSTSSVSIMFDSVTSTSYEKNKTFDVDGKSFTANVMYATDGTVGNKGAFVRVGYNSSNASAIPAKFGVSGDGGALEMNFDVQNALGVTYTIGGEMTGKDITNWYILASTNGGTTWATIGSGTTIGSTLTATLSQKADARFALVITGKNPRLDLRGMIISVGGSSVNPDPVNPNPVDPTPTDGSISVSEALNIIAGLTANQKTTTKYTITGIISGNIEAYNSQYNNATFDMNDGSGDSITVFRAKDGSNGIDFTASSFASKIFVGNRVTVEGYLQKYEKDNKVTLEICDCKVIETAPVAKTVDLSDVTTNSYLKINYKVSNGKITDVTVKAVVISHIDKEYNIDSVSYGVIYTKKSNVEKLIKSKYTSGNGNSLATFVNGSYAECSIKEEQDEFTVCAVLEMDLDSEYVAVVVCEKNGKLVFANQATLKIKDMINYYLTNNLITDAEQVKVLQSLIS